MYNKMINCVHLALGSIYSGSMLYFWCHQTWNNSLAWTDALDWYNGRKSAEHNKCKIEDRGSSKREDMRSTTSHLMQAAMWIVFWWKMNSVLFVATVPGSLFPHLSVIPLVITAISLAREGISYLLLLSCDDGWDLMFSRMYEQTSITQSITARSIS